MFNKILTIVLGLVIATSVWSTNVAAQEIVTDGLISLWTLDRSDINGKTVKDISSDNDGTIEGNPKLVDGKIEEALKFDGEKGVYVDCGNDKSISNLSNTYTIEAWANFTVASNYPGLFQRGDKTEASQIEIYLQPNANLTTVHNRNSIYYVYWTPVPLNKWTHLAIVWDKKEWTVYYDGVKQSKTGGGGTAANPESGKTCYIGIGYTDHSMNGIIDEVKIYDRALNENEIQQNLKATSNTLAVEPVNKLIITWGKIKVKK
jgi:hypothetical protein